jgi:predicted DsbA family dithiol-disulfide isomerase
MLKSAFAKEGIEYNTVDVEADTTAAEAAGIRGVPTTVITEEGKEDVRIVGFDSTTLKRIKEVLSIG